MRLPVHATAVKVRAQAGRKWRRGPFRHANVSLHLPVVFRLRADGCDDQISRGRQRVTGVAGWKPKRVSIALVTTAPAHTDS